MPSSIASSSEQCTSLSLSLVEALCARAIEVRDGSVTWIDPLTLGRKDRAPKRLDFHVYQGVAGIALFLAASFRYLQAGDRARELALRGLEPLRRQLRRLVADPEKAQNLQISLSGINGLGSYVYALARVGDWLDDLELLGEAQAVAGLITPERIAADHALDVFSGSAGSLLAVLALDRVSQREDFTPDSTALDVAMGCAEHLMAHHQEDESGSGGWLASGRPAWCGWAHGVAGIAHALTRLALRTGRNEPLDVALRSLEFERRHFDAEAQNWLDLRASERSFITALCHGAPGIALGRLSLLEATGNDSQIHQEIERAMATTGQAEELELDFVCCGNMGRAEILWHVGGHGFPMARERGTHLAHHVAETAQGNSGRFRWFEAPHEDVFSPCFFSGAAGVGYTFLRMAVDEPTPCIMALE